MFGKLSPDQIHYDLLNGEMSREEIKLREKELIAPGVTVGDYIEILEGLDVIEVRGGEVRSSNSRHK